MDNIKRVTNLPANSSSEKEGEAPNPARNVQSFVGEVMSIVSKPADMANLGVAKATNWLSNVLPSFPAARLFVDMVVGNLKMPDESQEDWPVGNCAEPKAINQALNDGARKRDLQVATIDVKTGKPKPCCLNCKKTTRGTTVLTEPFDSLSQSK
jgi:hypothetical protein